MSAISGTYCKKYEVEIWTNFLVTIKVGNGERTWGAGWFQNFNTETRAGSQVRFKEDDWTKRELVTQNRYAALGMKVKTGVDYNVVRVVKKCFKEVTRIR